MESFSDPNHAAPALHLTDRQLFEKLLSSPREAMTFVERYQFDKYVTPLLVVGGIMRAFDRMAMKNAGDTMSLLTIVGIAVIGGALLGWLSYYLYAAFVGITGKWLNGRANFDSIVRMLAYSMAPMTIGLALMLLQILWFGSEIFKSEETMNLGSMTDLIVYYVCMILELLLVVHTIRLAVIGTSVIQQFSNGKAFLNLMLPGLLLVGIILVIWGVVSLF